MCERRAAAYTGPLQRVVMARRGPGSVLGDDSLRVGLWLGIGVRARLVSLWSGKQGQVAGARGASLPGGACVSFPK